MSKIDPEKQNTSGVLSAVRFDPDPQAGLTSEQASRRAAEGLVNTAVKAPSKTIAQIVKDNIFTYFNLIFAVLAALLIIAGSFKSLTFLPVVLANIAIGIIQEIRAKQVLDKLTVLNSPTALAVRDSEVCELPTDQLVLDDIVEFRAGSQICADAEVKSGEVFVNESLLTGESVEIRKLPGDALLSGSFVVSGTCRARLDKVGADSYASRLTLQAGKADRKERSEMIRVLGKIVGAAGIIIIPVGLALFAQQYWAGGRSFSESIVSMVAAVIGMIPEGLYLLTSVALAVSMIRLAMGRVMLHDMKSIETLARVDVLCVDKTGTITDTKMFVADMVSLDKRTDAEALISDFVAAQPFGNITNDALKARFTTPSGRQVLEVLPFSSAYKYSAVRFADGTYALGAPEFILHEDYAQWQQKVEEHSAKGYRVLLLAASECAGEGQEGMKRIEKATPLALILLENSIRENASKTFGYFAQQDVQIKVISGDSPVTVSRVAGQAGIAGAEKFVDARTLETEEQIADAAEKYTVFGRVTPDQKRSLIRALKAAGHTVGMTGDGVNDVLALKDADCSVAMASGCEAAVQVSQMVLLDSDFAAMPEAVAEGRRVVNNIQRSASLFLVKNIFSLIAALFSILFAMKYPLIPSQITLIAAFTIGVPGFFLALVPNHERIKGSFLKNVLVKALPAGLTDALMVIIFAQVGRSMGLPEADIATACTVLLAVIGFMILTYISWPLNAMRVCLIIGCAAGLTLAACILPDIFEMTPLTGKSLTLLLVFIVISIPVLFGLTKLVEHLANRKR